MEIVKDNEGTLEYLQEKMSYINQNVVNFAYELADLRPPYKIEKFDRNMASKFETIASYASNFSLIVRDDFLNANYDMGRLLSRPNKIGRLSNAELSKLNNILGKVKQKMENFDEVLETTMKEFRDIKSRFVKLTKNIMKKLEELHYTIDMEDVANSQRDYVRYIKTQIDVFRLDMNKDALKSRINQKIDEIKRRMKAMDAIQAGLPQQIENIVF